MAVLTPAIPSVTLGHAPPAKLWALFNLAFVGDKNLRRNVLIRITRKDGVVLKFVVNCFPASATLAHGPVMKGYAVHVGIRSMQNAIVESYRRKCYAGRQKRRRKARKKYPEKCIRGKELSTAKPFVIALMIVGFTDAPNPVILRKRQIKEEKKCGSTHSKPKFHDDKLKCDDECARLQRNRDIAAALRVDIDPLTTTATGTQPRSHDTETFPYSDETLDLYIQSSSSSTLATLQGFEASLHSLAIQTSQKCTRFSPCRSQLRAFIHSLAADWGFQSESFDPEPVRHVLVSKTQGWISPGVATGSQPRIGIRGLSVAECIKLRDRECSKKKDTKKNAAENAGRKTQQEDDEWTVTETKDEFGWSRVVSKKKPEWWNDSDIQKTFSQPGNQQSGNGEGRSNWFSGGRFGSLVLKSGVGRGKEMATSRSSDGSKAPVFLAKGEKVVEDWEEEIKKEEDEQKENGKVTETTAFPDLPDDLPWDHGFEGEGESHVVESGFWIAPGKY
ncbi:FKBP12-associated protein [Ophidiomyces ophidiicola]|nr:FKBP12-associated protein [Ophidiomyces ophidiicola]KAI1923552.1 FKBP12-associated protein [Ophidiomyces ophidiicola]KAI2149584.1 FKBP12-associated protein [Ophidiomyces ophidiicola]KAI2378007.1 FKBP12-associated protein [Ophidiomyces ophidiicola]KAI2386980.1 FKBP12-associated protein [Ophidiomyces ophidiicola]